MRTTIDACGKLEIPLEFRERARLTPGAEVEVELNNGGGLQVRPVLLPALPTTEDALPAPRLEHQGTALIDTGLTYDGSWDDLTAAVRRARIDHVAGVTPNEDAV